jgi:hypothetical protein
MSKLIPTFVLSINTSKGRYPKGTGGILHCTRIFTIQKFFKINLVEQKNIHTFVIQFKQTKFIAYVTAMKIFYPLY